MKVCVFGAGAIGGHLAMRLAKGGAEVSVVARGTQLAAIRAAKLEAIRSLAEQAHGVTLQSRSQSEKSEMGTDSIVVESGATLKGVRFIRVEPVEPGIYQAVAELDVRY